MPIEPTDEMTNAIANNIESLLSAMQQVAPFSTGDVMSAALHIMVDAGMVAVEHGTSTPEKLIDDLCRAVRQCVTEFGRNKSPAGLQ